MRLWKFAGLDVLCETPGDGGSGGGSTENVGAGSSESAKPAGSGSGNNENRQNSNTPGAAGASSAKFEDDARFKGVLGDLAKERTKRQTFERELAAARAEVEQERRIKQALAGVVPRTQQEVNDEQVRERLKSLGVPHNSKLANLSEDQIDRLLSMAENAGNIEASIERQHTIHGRKMLDSAVSAMGKALGGKLSERQTDRLQWAYFQEAQRNPQFLERHESGDPTLIEEFVNGFIEDFVEPGRRKALAAEQSRMRGVPTSRDRSVVGAGGKKLDLSKEEDFAEAALAAYKGHGGSFGER